MSLKKTMGRVFPFVDSDRRKQMVVDSVLKSELKNDGVINIHRYTPNNVGDYFSGPHHYFQKLNGKVLDISEFRSVSKRKRKNWIEKTSSHALIVGGGGLLNIKHFEKQMKLFEVLADCGKKIVLWGPGHNSSKDLDPKGYNVDVSKFGLAGTRDFNMKTDWVPCVSCMHPIFDKNHQETREVGIVFCNKSNKNKALLKKLSHYPSTSNTTDLMDMVTFIGNSSIIVTDSYHAMYWAILLGKKTVVVPTTSKFYDFKYPSVISSYDNFEKDLKKAQSYSGVLEECREINRQFAGKVFDYLNM